MYLEILVLRVLINLSAATNFPSLCIEYVSISLSFNHFLKEILSNSLPLSTYILFGIVLDSFKNFWKALVIVISYLSFKATTQAYLLKILITHNKNLNPLLNLFINCISANQPPKFVFESRINCSFFKFSNNWFV